MAPSFQLSSLIASLPDSEGGAWGPPASTDSSLNEVPYAPYSKGDKLGRMADWTQDSGKDNREGGRGGRQGYNRNYRGWWRMRGSCVVIRDLKELMWNRPTNLRCRYFEPFLLPARRG